MQNQPEVTPIQQLREGLKSKGDGSLVRIHMSNYVEEALVQQVVDKLEKKSTMVAVGIDEWSVTDKLILELLRESAGL